MVCADVVSFCSAESCSVVVRLSRGAAAVSLSVGEVELYDTAGARLPASSLTASLSTVHQSGTDSRKAASAIDGNVSTFAQTAAGDTSPRLQISYPCASGATALSRVAVVQGPASAGRHLLQTFNNINSFTLDFVDARLLLDRPSFVFSGGKASYDITLATPGGCRARGRLWP